jgi:amino acid permease
MFNVFMCSLMLCIGNLCYEAFVDQYNWARAFEHSYYQFVAIVAYYYIWERTKEPT